jgi:Glycosyltransferase family 92
MHLLRVIRLLLLACIALSAYQWFTKFRHIDYDDTHHSYLAFCLVVKDQNEDLREWVDYHHSLGASRFYIYDDGGSGPTPAKEVLQDFIASGVVRYKDTHKRPKRQLANYQRCLISHRHQHQWLAFLDADEFIVIDKKHVSIPQMLSNYTQYGGVGLNWVMFGSSGYDKRPQGGVGNYTMCNRYDSQFTSMLCSNMAHDSVMTRSIRCIRQAVKLSRQQAYKIYSQHSVCDQTW